MDIREVQQQRNIKWATRLEEVLSDFDALQVCSAGVEMLPVHSSPLSLPIPPMQLFQSWMGVDDDSSEHPLRLHFAIVAYREMLAREDPRAGQLAREIYNKFLRPKTGLCDFIEPPIRERVGQRLRQQNGKPPADLFSECQAPLDTFLRRQHAIFGSPFSANPSLPCVNSSPFQSPPMNSWSASMRPWLRAKSRACNIRPPPLPFRPKHPFVAPNAMSLNSPSSSRSHNHL